MGAEREDWSLPLLFPEKSGTCEICGELHATESCPLVEGLTDHVRDSASLSYARLTLPEGLMLRELSDGNKTVVTTKSFSKGLKFGPFIAKTSNLIDVRIEFPLKVFFNEEESVYLETYEEIFCNWMCLVLPASCAAEQNMICFQMKTSIYFCSLRNIEKGEELRVWYAPHYADKMGVHALPKPSNLIHSSDEEFLEIYESLQNGVEMQDHQYLPQDKENKKTRRKPPKKLILGENYYRQVPPSDKLPEELLDAPRRSEWECATCGQVEHHVAAFARHLMTHFRKVRKSIPCPYCDQNFWKDGYKRQIHLELCRKKKISELAQNPDKLNLTKSPLTEKGVEPEMLTNDCTQSKNEGESSEASTVWNKTVVCETSQDEVDNNQTKNKIKDSLRSAILENCEGNVSAKGTNIDVTCNDWDMSQGKDISHVNVTENLPIVCSTGDDKSDKDKKNKTFEQLQNDRENLDENLLVKSHLNSTIFDLSDDIDFHITKSLDDLINDDCNLDKSLPFTKNRGLDLFGGVEANILGSNVCNPHQSSSCYSLEKNGFLQTDFATCNDVTDEERNRIVENLLSETDDKFFSSDYDMADECVAEIGSQVKVNYSSKNKEPEKDKKNQKNPSKASGDYKCEICNKCYSKSTYLYRHLRKHTGEYRCNTCFMVFTRKENLQNHRMSCANEADTQQSIQRVRVLCKFCHMQFHSLPSLKEHMDQHYCPSNTWKCVCNESSDNVDLFPSHKCHSDKPVMICTKCGRRFNSVDKFVAHKNHPILQKRKKKDCSLLCEMCGVVTKTRTGARLHRSSVHGEKQYKCSICEKMYSRKDKLNEHILRHKGQKSWECQICSKTFSSESLLRKHRKDMHNNQSFTCSYCKKEFRQKSSLTKHLTRMHEKVNKFDCAFCDSKFSTMKSLNSHLKKNHVKQMFTCIDCGEVFPLLWKLKLHIRREHSGMYKCAYCRIEIRLLSSMKRHLIALHGDRVKEWSDPKFISNMKMAREGPAADAEVEQHLSLGMANATNRNVSISDILQTAADEVIEEESIVLNENIGENVDASRKTTIMDIIPSTEFDTPILQENVTDIGATHDSSVLKAADGMSQLVSMDGDVVTMPITFISDLSTPVLNTADDQSSTVMTQSSLLSFPVMLPDGSLLTLDANLMSEQPMDESVTLLPDVSGATTSAFVLADESVAESNLQLQNDVLYYIVDTSASDSIISNNQ